MIHVFGLHEVKGYGMAFSSEARVFERMMTFGAAGLQEALRAIESHGFEVVSVLPFQSIHSGDVAYYRVVAREIEEVKPVKKSTDGPIPYDLPHLRPPPNRRCE